MLVTKASERWIPLQKAFPLFFFPPPFSASSFCILLAVCIISEASARIWAQFNHVPREWIKGALQSSHSKGREEMGTLGSIQGLVAEQQPQSLAPATPAPALDRRPTSSITCSSGCSCASRQGFATACLCC